MPFPTTNATQELPAINQILTSCGQAPVTTLDQTNPEVAIAYDTLLQVSKEVQSEGWTFNREYHYEFTKDNNDEILIPNNVLQIKLTENAQNTPYHAVRRSGKLYDRQNHTYQWTYSPIECDVILGRLAMGADFLNPAACVELIAGAAVGSTGNAAFGTSYPANG